jgi:N-acetylmuramoyl-L-alanine amidase
LVRGFDVTLAVKKPYLGPISISAKIKGRFAWTGFTGGFKVGPGGFTPKWIIIHHSFSPDGEVRNWDSLRKYHMSYRRDGRIITREEYDFAKAKGVGRLEEPWTDIGYNLGIESVNGKLTVLKGRPIGTAGAHAIGFNDKSIGICLVGNYDMEKPSDERLYIVSSLCRQLQFEFHIPRDQVIGHRETFLKRGVPVEKSCPGEHFNLNALRLRLRA